MKYTNGYTLLLDTETANKTKTRGFNPHGNMVFDIGFLILDEELNIVEEYQAINTDIFNDESYMENYFFGEEKLNWYKDNKDLIRADGATIKKKFDEVFVKYPIKRIAAYNVAFDEKSIKSTNSIGKYGDWIPFGLFNVIDLYHMACQALVGNELYIVACMENGKVSEAGNVSTTAEAVYCFINNDHDFIEDHTALNDCYIERDIYQWILDEEHKRGTIFKTNANTAAWRLVQKKKGK